MSTSGPGPPVGSDGQSPSPPTPLISGAHALDEVGVHATTDEVGVGQQPTVKVEVGLAALDDELRQRAAQARNGVMQAGLTKRT